MRGNERLTAALALVLLLLLAAEGATVAFLRVLFPLHVFIGLVLLPLTGLKLTSVGYRAVRYYLGAPGYRRRGPPAILLRLLAPALVALTAALLGSGVGLLAVPPGPSLLLFLHKASFVLWFMAMSVHVLAYLWHLPGLALADWRRVDALPRGRVGRQGVVLGGLVVGVVLAAALMPAASGWIHWVGTVGIAG
ncbi:MAG TPA: hypothetical protein VMW47_06115 [Verrucomicrobiae bacterium]|nr:hypothetical protein [Verrucomicrobiae bacterium]